MPPTQVKQGLSEPTEEFVKAGRTLFGGERASTEGSGGQQQQQQQPPPPPPPPPPRASLFARARELASRAAAATAAAVRAEARLAMMESSAAAAERARERAAATASSAAPGVPLNRTASGLVLVAPKVDQWSGRRRRLSAALAASPLSPLFNRLGAAAASVVDTPAARVVAARATAAKDAASDVADRAWDRWESSDSPFVHRLQDMGESLKMEETEQARCVAAIRRAQPGWDAHDFLALQRADITHLLGAYLRGDEELLRSARVAPELLERLRGMFAVWAAEGEHMDPNVIDVSDVKLVEIKFVGDTPTAVIYFTAQQINCVRDARGQVVEGAPDDVQSVYWAWAVEQVQPGSDDAEPDATAARWRLRDMMLRGFTQISV